MNDCWIFKQLHRPKHIITWFNLDVSLTAFKINTKLSFMSSRSSGCLKNILQPTNGQYENQSDFYFCLLGNIKCGLSRLLRMVVSGKWWEKTLKLDFKLIDSAVFSYKIATNINKLWDEYIQNINEWWQKRYRFSRISEHQPKLLSTRWKLLPRDKTRNESNTYPNTIWSRWSIDGLTFPTVMSKPSIECTLKENKIIKLNNVKMHIDNYKLCVDEAYLIENVRADNHLDQIVSYQNILQFVWFSVGHVPWSPWQYEI